MAVQFLEFDFPTKIHLGEKDDLKYTVKMKLARKLPQTLFLKMELRSTLFGQWIVYPFCINSFGTW